MTFLKLLSGEVSRIGNNSTLRVTTGFLGREEVGLTDYVEKKKSRKGPDGVMIEPRNFLTNPPQMGVLVMVLPLWEGRKLGRSSSPSTGFLRVINLRGSSL